MWSKRSRRASNCPLSHANPGEECKSSFFFRLPLKVIINWNTFWIAVGISYGPDTRKIGTYLRSMIPYQVPISYLHLYTLMCYPPPFSVLVLLGVWSSLACPIPPNRFHHLFGQRPGPIIKPMLFLPPLWQHTSSRFTLDWLLCLFSFLLFEVLSFTAKHSLKRAKMDLGH